MVLPIKGSSNPAWAERNRTNRTIQNKQQSNGNVKRYRAGKVASWVNEESRSSSSEEDDERKSDDVVVRNDDDDDDDVGTESSSDDESEGEDEEESEDEDARDLRREILRKKMVEKMKTMNAGSDDVVATKKNAVEDNNSSSSSEYETDTDDDDSDEDDSDEDDSEGNGPKLFKPVFVSKAKREANMKADDVAVSVLDRKKDDNDDDDNDDDDDASARRIKKENAKLAVQKEITLEYQKELAEKDYVGDEVDTDSDDETEANARENYESWKVREFKRIVRDRCKQRIEVGEEEERERIKNMTEEERELEAAKAAALKKEREGTKEKTKMRFMQKYYHKGAFFQEAGDDAFTTTEKAEIFTSRDFNEATASEKGVDRQNVPEAMKLRHGQFGRAGRSKWTHLANEDTTFVNTEDARLRNATEALAATKNFSEFALAGQQKREDGGGGSNRDANSTEISNDYNNNNNNNNKTSKKSFNNRLTVDKTVERLQDEKRAGMKKSSR